MGPRSGPRSPRPLSAPPGAARGPAGGASLADIQDIVRTSGLRPVFEVLTQRIAELENAVAGLEIAASRLDDRLGAVSMNLERLAEQVASLFVSDSALGALGSLVP